MPAHSTEVRYLVLSADCAFEDGIMDWDYLVAHADAWMADCRAVEIAVTVRPGHLPQFKFGRDVTDEAIAAWGSVRVEDDAPWVNPNAEHSTHYRGIGL